MTIKFVMAQSASTAASGIKRAIPRHAAFTVQGSLVKTNYTFVAGTGRLTDPEQPMRRGRHTRWVRQIAPCTRSGRLTPLTR